MQATHLEVIINLPSFETIAPTGQLFTHSIHFVHVSASILSLLKPFSTIFAIFFLNGPTKKYIPKSIFLFPLEILDANFWILSVAIASLFSNTSSVSGSLYEAGVQMLLAILRPVYPLSRNWLESNCRMTS